MNSTTMIVLVTLATLALVQGIAINSKSAATAESPATSSVNVDNGIAVQSGYEGYILTPKKPSSSISSSISSTWLALPKLKLLKSLLKPVASFLIAVSFKTLKTVAHLFVALVLGVITTTAVCTYTPLCTITPGDQFNRFRDQSISERMNALMRAYMTSENVEMVAELAKSALKKAEEPAAEANEEESETAS